MPVTHEPSAGRLDRLDRRGRSRARLSICRRTASASISRTFRAASSVMAVRILRPRRSGSAVSRGRPLAYDRASHGAADRYVVTYGLPLIFGIVLLEQLGAPIPAIPVLVVAGALSVDRDLSALAGPARRGGRVADRRLASGSRSAAPGHRILKTLCRISLSPDSCVRQTESVFERWGMPSLLFAKFIPASRRSLRRWPGRSARGSPTFLLFDGGRRAALGGRRGRRRAWSSTARSTGSSNCSPRSAAARSSCSAAASAVFVAFKWWQRRRFYKVLRMARITVEELRRLMDEGQSPSSWTCGRPGRARATRAGSGRRGDGGCGARRAARGAAAGPGDHPLLHLTQRGLGRPCGAHADRRGFKLVRPLAGGLEAWERGRVTRSRRSRSSRSGDRLLPAAERPAENEKGRAAARPFSWNRTPYLPAALSSVPPCSAAPSPRRSSRPSGT